MHNKPTTRLKPDTKLLEQFRSFNRTPVTVTAIAGLLGMAVPVARFWTKVLIARGLIKQLSQFSEAGEPLHVIRTKARRPPSPPIHPASLAIGPEACGARTRAGTQCKRLGSGAGGRCRMHGGDSTGPRTEEGKSKSAQNGFGRRLPS